MSTTDRFMNYLLPTKVCLRLGSEMLDILRCTQDKCKQNEGGSRVTLEGATKKYFRNRRRYTTILFFGKEELCAGKNEN